MRAGCIYIVYIIITNSICQIHKYCNPYQLPHQITSRGEAQQLSTEEHKESTELIPLTYNISGTMPSTAFGTTLLLLLS